jgi:hypothetical protein
MPERGVTSTTVKFWGQCIYKRLFFLGVRRLAICDENLVVWRVGIEPRAVKSILVEEVAMFKERNSDATNSFYFSDSN